MAVEVFWDNPQKTILRYCLQGHWTWEELFAARDEAYRLMGAVPYRVAMIFDGSASAGVPSRDALKHIRQLIQEAHPQTGLTLIVLDAHPLPWLLRTLFSIVDKVYRVRWPFEFAYSLADARARIAQEAEAPA